MLSLCHQKLLDKKHSRKLSNQNIEWMRYNAYILASLHWLNFWLVWKSTQKLKKQSVKYVWDFSPKLVTLSKCNSFNDHKYSYLKSQTLWFSQGQGSSIHFHRSCVFIADTPSVSKQSTFMERNRSLESTIFQWVHNVSVWAFQKKP